MIKPLLTACLGLVSATAFSQTLFTYGGDTVTVPQFKTAYAKNNTGKNTAAELRTYLDLYIAARLKIKEAKARGYDTLPQFVADLAALRDQLLPGYVKDEGAINALVEEARRRARKDIHLQHIFISFTRDGLTDTAAALARAHEVLKKLERGVDFAAVARETSDAPEVQRTGGDAGYITVFTLPYAIENVVYATPVGKTAPLYTSPSGYHIFKNAGERPALGTLKAAQILIALPPDATTQTKARAKKQIDSLYNALLKGANFSTLATRFSNDAVSAQAEGQMLPIGVGMYDAVFENAVFALPKNGAFTKPFYTTHGYHIVKRLSVLSYADSSEAALQQLREKVEANDRMESTHARLAARILREAPFKKSRFAEPDLWMYSDSVLDGKPPAGQQTLTDSSVLFTLGEKKVTVADWIMHAQVFRYTADGTGLQPYALVWKAFVQATALAYYKDHLEEYNDAFRQQLDEFKDGNLFFEIMQRNVWNKAQEDTAALQTFYKAHAPQYTWTKSADAVVFYAADAATANRLKAALQKSPTAWKKIIASFGEKVTTDSARFELSQLPGGAVQALQKGSVTQLVINASDNTASLALILKMYAAPAQRSFTEAKGLVVTDYQAELEKTWIAELKRKYPVVINEAELERL